MNSGIGGKEGEEAGISQYMSKLGTWQGTAWHLKEKELVSGDKR